MIVTLANWEHGGEECGGGLSLEPRAGGSAVRPSVLAPAPSPSFPPWLLATRREREPGKIRGGRVGRETLIDEQIPLGRA